MLPSLVDTEGELSVWCVNGNVWRDSRRKTAAVRFGRLLVVVGKIEINKDETHPKEYHDVVSSPLPPLSLLPTWWRWNRLSALNHRGGRRWGRNGCGVKSAGVEERERSTRIMLSALCALDNGRRLFSWISDGSDNKSCGSLATLKFREGFSTVVCAF